MKTYILILLSVFSSIVLHAQSSHLYIQDFIVKENLTANGKIAIITVDSLENADEKINGIFKFSINGFEETLQFNHGVAVPANPIESTTFVYFKHKNQEKSTGKLYFLYKKDNEITPIKIYGLLLLIIPAIILLIAYVVKRLFSTLIVLVIVYAYFSYSKGLSFSKIFESAFDMINNFF